MISLDSYVDVNNLYHHWEEQDLENVVRKFYNVVREMSRVGMSNDEMLMHPLTIMLVHLISRMVDLSDESFYQAYRSIMSELGMEPHGEEVIDDE